MEAREERRGGEGRAEERLGLSACGRASCPLPHTFVEILVAASFCFSLRGALNNPPTPQPRVIRLSGRDRLNASNQLGTYYFTLSLPQLVLSLLYATANTTLPSFCVLVKAESVNALAEDGKQSEEGGGWGFMSLSFFRAGPTLI